MHAGIEVGVAAGRTGTTTLSRLLRGTALALGVAAAIGLSGCTDPAEPTAAPSAGLSADPTATADGTATPAPSATPPVDAPILERLPVQSALVGQTSEATGDVRIERRADGSVWLVLTGFSLANAYEPVLHVSTDPLVEGRNELTPDDFGQEIGPVTAAPEQSFDISDATQLDRIRSVLLIGRGDPGVSRLAATQF